jgi:hypothetical protein
MRNRPDNWSTKRLTKSTWTPLLSKIELQANLLDQNVNELEFELSRM